MVKQRIRYQTCTSTYTSFSPGAVPSVSSSQELVDYMERAGTSTGRNTKHELRAFTSYSYQSQKMMDGSFYSYVPTKYLSTGAVQSYGSSSSGSGIRGLLSLGASMPSPNFGDPKVNAAINSLDAQVASNILSNIKNQKFDVGMFIGELNQTVGLLAHTARRVSSAYTALRRGSLRDLEVALGCGRVSRSREKRFHNEYKRDPVSAASNTWLEVQYGWRPLLNDAYGAAQAFAAHNLGESPKRVKVSASGQQSVVIPFMSKLGLETKVLNNDYTVRVRRVAELQVSSPVFATASALGLTNPLSLAWNLLPFSFVVDWFIPIGTFLGNLDATAGMQLVRGTRAQRLEGNVFSSVSGSYTGGGGYYASCRKSGIQYSRSVGLPSAIPPVPRIGFPSSVAQFGSALALLQQAFKR